MLFKRVVSFCSLFCLSILTQVAVVNTANASSKEFPGRDLYPDVPVISLADFKAKYKNVVIVDVRSAYEYDTLHISGARNIPVADRDFVEKMQKLRANTKKDIIVYCNGKTCMKSYKAGHECVIHKIDNVTSYDAGIWDWARAMPAQTLLFERPLMDPKKLISKAEFHRHLISPDEFSDRIANTADIVLDVRDRYQREGISLYVGREFHVYLDDKKRLDRFINKAMQEKKALLVYDAAGKQVAWLQYYLEEKGMKNYFFMDGGIHKYYSAMEAADFKSVSSK